MRRVTKRSSGPPRRSSWTSWLAVPWHDLTLLIAIVVAAAAPTMLVASADLWRTAAQDGIAATTSDQADPRLNGIDVAIDTDFSLDAVRAADDDVVSAVKRIADLSAPDRSVYTLPGLISIGPSPLRTVGPQVVLFADARALDSVDVVDVGADAAEGVWVTTWFAERHGLEVGDLVAFGNEAIGDDQWDGRSPTSDAAAVLRIGATYAPLWSPDPDHEVDPTWGDVPPEVVPRFVRAFNEPNIELVLMAEDTLLASGLTGVVRWRAPLDTVPDDFGGLVQLRNDVRRFETALVGTGTLATGLDAIATNPGSRPRLMSDIFETVGSVESAAGQLDAPLAAAQAIGASIGLVAIAVVGYFFTERRRSEFRLLASEGERWPKMSGRVGAQLAAPVVIGASGGVGAAVLSARWPGPADGFDAGSLSWAPILIVTLLSTVVVAVVAGIRGGSTLDSTGRSGQRMAAAMIVPALVITTAGAWIQAGRTSATDQGGPDLAVVALPVLVILSTVLALIAGLIWLLRRAGRSLERLPTEAFLAARRVASGSTGLAVVAGALGLGVGLLVFSAALTSTLDRTVEIKLSTAIGGETKVSLIDPFPPEFVPPAPTTVMFTSDTALTPGDQRVRVIAIDPATYAAAVDWPEQFGAELSDVLDALGGPADESLPVIAVSGEPVPTTGAFGFTQTFPYRVVDRIAAFPGAGESGVTLLVFADAIDDMALADSSFDSREAAAEAQFRLPTERFRQRAISRAPAGELTAALDAVGVRYGDVISRAARNQAPSVVANRAAFGYLATVGFVAVTGALGSLALYLSARRRERALTAVMTRAMGLSANRSASTSVLEVTALTAVAIVAGFAAAPLLVRRLSVRFDPAPTLPPSVPVAVDWPPLLALAVTGLTVLAGSLWLTERTSARRPAAEVVRDAA